MYTTRLTKCLTKFSQRHLNNSPQAHAVVLINFVMTALPNLIVSLRYPLYAEYHLNQGHIKAID